MICRTRSINYVKHAEYLYITIESAVTTSRFCEEWCKSGLVNIVGGCCGTNTHHIKHFVDAAKKEKPRYFNPKIEKGISEFSGLENFTIRSDSNFTMIGERTNVTGSLKFARLIKEKNYDEALEVALEQVRNGANIIDVNMD